MEKSASVEINFISETLCNDIASRRNSGANGNRQMLITS